MLVAMLVPTSLAGLVKATPDLVLPVGQWSEQARDLVLAAVQDPKFLLEAAVQVPKYLLEVQ